MSKETPDYVEDLDRFAPEYTTPTDARAVDQKTCTFLMDEVVPELKGPDVLEMGYGDGGWTGRLVAQFSRTHLVDASPELLETARGLYGDSIVTYESYFEEFSPPKKFDTILCTWILEHVVDPVLVLEKARQWLAPDGELLVAVPNALSLHRLMAVKMGLQADPHEMGASDASVGHRRVYDDRSMTADLEAAGFEIVERLHAMCKPLPNGMLTHLSDEQLRGLYDTAEFIAPENRGMLVYRCRSANA